MTSLVIAEHDNTQLKSATLSVIQAAAQLPGDVHVLLAGQFSASLVEEVQRLSHVHTILTCNSKEYEYFFAENMTTLLLSCAKNYTHILAPASTLGKNILPRLAALLDVNMVSDVIAIVSENTFKRPIYAGNAIATVQCADAIKVITVRTTGFDAAEASGSAPTTRPIRVALSSTSSVSAVLSK